MSIPALAYTMFFAPLIGAALSGLLFINKNPRYAHVSTLLLMFVSVASAAKIFLHFMLQDLLINIPLYTAFDEPYLNVKMGLYLDRLSASMALMVTLISFLVHVFSLEYMKDDPHQPRFFSYISLFTFMMLLLVLGNNLLMLFAGWEGVGLVSYLLIGFWMTKESAVFANMKAFVVNRVGDLGFIIAIAATFYLTGTFDYVEILNWFKNSVSWANMFSFAGFEVNFVEFICFFYFIGAMGKSAQIPLHLWLPDSMEGPTPISALIHAATMVTAGIFMVSRFHEIFTLAPLTSDFILVVGATTSLAMGLVGLVQSDIKRIIAYSTLSQLGYMVLALGLNAYNLAIFHLLTHAFFKALLFLGAGAIIIAMHHNQDIMKMGGLWKTHKGLFALMIIGSISLMGVAPFAGFYSKDLIIMASEHSTSAWAHYASFCATAGVYITSLYSLRLLYYVFLKSPADAEKHYEPVGIHALWPLWVLAFFACIAGHYGYELLFIEKFFSSSLSGPSYSVIDKWLHHHSSSYEFTLHSFSTIPFYLILLSVVTLLLIYGPLSTVWQKLKSTVLKPVICVLECKYGFDLVLEKIIIPFGHWCGNFASKVIDGFIIDKVSVDGQAFLMQSVGRIFRSLHTGIIQNYVFIMTISLVILWVLVN